MQDIQQDKHHDEGEALRGKLFADIGKTKNQLLKEEDERHQQAKIPENPQHRLEDRFAQDGMIERRIGDRLARLPGCLSQWQLARLAFRRQPETLLMIGLGALIRHVVAFLQGKTLAIQERHRARGVKGHAVDKRALLGQVAGPINLTIGIRLKIVANVEHEGAGLVGKLIVSGAREQLDEKQFLRRNKRRLNPFRRHAGHGESTGLIHRRQAMLVNELNARVLPHGLRIQQIENRDRRRAEGHDGHIADDIHNPGADTG